MSKKKNHRVFLSLGANIGHRKKTLLQALQEITKDDDTLIAISPFYETEALGFSTKHLFLNICVEINTLLNIDDFYEKCKEAELLLGRKREDGSVTYSDRTIDIDILYFDDISIHNDHLQIPHPRLHVRKFVLQPLNDIAPNKKHPLLNKSTNELLKKCADESKLNVYLGQ